MKKNFISSIVGLSSIVGIVSCTSFQNQNKHAHRVPAAEDLSLIRPGFVSLHELDPKKRTVCAMTLNSDNEVLTFQKHLSKKEFQFVELVNKPSGWLSEAVEAKVSCDILIVSGHFGGTFFGTRGRLALEELERSSCSSKAQGIFRNVKEVFLFGCNTLAGKERDHRTPEEYVDVLIADGFSRPQAEQTAAFRYSPLGGTFHNRMAQVFAGVPRIYGFTSVGPSGKTVQPFLNKYLENKNYSTYLDQVDRNDNKDFLSILKVSKVAQTAGVETSVEKPIPRCVFGNSEVGEKQKLDLAHQLLSDPKSRFLHLSEVGDYLLKSPRSGGNRNYEVKLQRNWVQDQKLKEDFVNVFSKGLAKYPSLRLTMLDFGLYMGWLKPAEASKVLDEVLGNTFKDGLTPHEVEYLTSIAELGGRFVSYNMIKDYFEGALQSERLNLIHVLYFLKPQDKKVQQKLVETMKRAEDPWERYSVVSLFAGMPNLSTELQWNLVDALKNDSFEDVRMLAAWSFSQILPDNQRIHQELLQAMNRDAHFSVREAAIDSLAVIRPQGLTGTVFEDGLIERLQSDEHAKVRSAVIKAIVSMNGSGYSDKIQRALQEASRADSDDKVRAAAKKALSL